MKIFHKNIAYVVIVLIVGTLLYAQDKQPERATVPFSNPAKPGFLEVGVHNGSITIIGYNGREVIVEAKVRERKIEESEALAKVRNEAERIAREQSRRIREVLERKIEEEKEKQRKTEGMTKLSPLATTGLTIEEENNKMEVDVSSLRRTVDLTIRVPFDTSLELSAHTNGNIKVEKVRGDIEINHHNGHLTLSEISGSVIAHTFNGDVEVTFTSVDPKKPMSFSTWSGDIDVTFPANVKANLKMNSDRGDIYSDFSIDIKPAVKKVEEDKRKEGGKYRISFDKSIYGTIGGGGQEIKFKTYSGDIFIRKAK